MRNNKNKIQKYFSMYYKNNEKYYIYFFFRSNFKKI